MSELSFRKDGYYHDALNEGYLKRSNFPYFPTTKNYYLINDTYKDLTPRRHEKLNVDNIFMINLDHRKDRLNQVKTEFNKIGLKFERISGVIVSDEECNNIKNWGGETYQKKGALGCTKAHYNTIKLAKERGYKRILICEDDLTFKTFNFVPVVNDAIKNLNEDFDVLYLGYSALKNENLSSKYLKHNNIYRSINSFTTFCYILHERMFDYLLDNLVTLEKPIDTFLCELSQLPDKKIYMLYPSLVYQCAGHSDIVGFKTYFPM